MKAKDGVPAACHPSSEQTLIQKMKSFFSFGHSDECQKYYEAVMLNPGLEVTPTRVLSEVIADFFLHPIGMLGSAIAEFSKNILGIIYFFLLQNEITMFCFVIALIFWRRNYFFNFSTSCI